jgi:hypothetical protein
MNSCSTPKTVLKFFAFDRHLPSLGVLALVCLLALFSQPASGQIVFGSMVGNVTDATGAAVPGAEVKITHISTNDVRTVQTDAAGAYTISTVTPGRYQVEVTREGFRTFVATDILVNQNNVIRVDAQLQVGQLAERVEVTTTAAAQLQTERADVHAEISTAAFIDLPQANRTFEGLLALVPGTAAPGAGGMLAGGTNNPSKSVTFAFNGTGISGGTVRVEGMNATNFWFTHSQSYVPSVEAIQNVNVATNANDAEQGLSGGATVNVMLKSGSNETHGGVYEYNIDSAFEANNFFANSSGITKPPHLVNNNAGGFAGGHIIKNKLFYFGSYEGDYARSAASGILSIPNMAQLGGDLSGSGAPIYDPDTGNADGTGRTPFPNKQIPANRISPVAQRIIPNIPATNAGAPGAVVNNFYMNQASVYNLHKIDTKVDFNATSKLRMSGRWASQPYYNTYQPVYGETLGGVSPFAGTGNGNYLQHGAGLAVSVSGSYVISPTFVVDAAWGKTSSHQVLEPNMANTRYGSDVLGIPGTNIGPLPWAGGVPNFAITNFVVMGASWPALDYIQPVYEYVANATKIKGSHTIRFGADLTMFHPRHIEVGANKFTFNGNMTTLKGGAGANPYNALGDFLLGDFYEGTNSRQMIQPRATLRAYEFAGYVRDQWHATPRLTINYGVRWEKYPVPTRDADNNGLLGVDGNGLYFLDPKAATVTICGSKGSGLPSNCGIHTSNKLFAPSVGIAYRPTEKLVLRAGYSLNPAQANMGSGQMLAFPGEVAIDMLASNPYIPAGNLSTGLPEIPVPTAVNGVFKIPAKTGNASSLQTKTDYTRGYYQSYNFTIQRELPGDLLAAIGYVGTHGVHLQSSVSVNYGQLGGGAASQPLAWLPTYSLGISTLMPWGSDTYNSLQATLNKRLSKGVSFQAAYTFSKDIGMGTSILIPEYTYYDHAVTTLDRTHHLVISGNYEVPFGKGKSFVTQGVGAAILGGWMVNGIYNYYSGAPFSVSSSSASCNCPGNTQTADQILSDVGVVGNGLGGQPYFNPLAFAPVTGARFGTSGFNTLRGPSNANIDLSLFRTFTITERFKAQIRAEALNFTNSPHFANPGANVSNLSVDSATGTVKALNGFSQITSTAPIGRTLDQRYMRFGLRLTF